MTHFCTSIQRQADFEICQKLPLKELIFEHQSLSRFGELETATLLEMLEAWKTSGGKAFLQWDLLHDEKSFEEAVEVIKKLPLEYFDAVRVQDLGAANWLRNNHSHLKLHWIVEGSNHNLKGLQRWSDFLKPQLDRFVLSSEIAGNILQRCISELPQECEILGIGSILLFYTPRHLLNPLNLNPDEPSEVRRAWVATLETPHRKLRTMENKHGTFLFYDRELFLLEHYSELKSWGLKSFRLDLQRVGMQWLNSVLVTDPENQESIKNLRENWPCKTFQGFFRANKTDKAIQRMKNPYRQSESSRPVAEVLEASKNRHLALLIKQRIIPGLQLWGLTPEGRILELETQPMMDMRHHQVEAAEPDQIVLIPHVKYAVPKTLIFAVQPELGKMR